MNIQFIVKDEQVYTIETNPRSSRTVPYISKTTDIPIVHLAVRIFFGEALPQTDYQYSLRSNKALTATKILVFLFEKLCGADVNLGPEMKSTGKAFGIVGSFEEATVKAPQGTGMHLLINGNMIIAVEDQDKEETLSIVKGLCDFGWTAYSIGGASNYPKENDILNIRLNKVDGDAPDIPGVTPSGTIDLVINTPPKGAKHRRDGFLIRHGTVEASTPCLTSLDTVNTLLRCVQYVKDASLSVMDIMKVSSFLVFL